MSSAFGMASMSPTFIRFPGIHAPYLSKVGTLGTDPYREIFLTYREKFEKSGFFEK